MVVSWWWMMIVRASPMNTIIVASCRRGVGPCVSSLVLLGLVPSNTCISYPYHIIVKLQYFYNICGFVTTWISYRVVSLTAFAAPAIYLLHYETDIATQLLQALLNTRLKKNIG